MAERASAEHEGDLHWYDLPDDEAEEDFTTMDIAPGRVPTWKERAFGWARGVTAVAR